MTGALGLNMLVATWIVVEDFFRWVIGIGKDDSKNFAIVIPVGQWGSEIMVGLARPRMMFPEYTSLPPTVPVRSEWMRATSDESVRTADRIFTKAEHTRDLYPCIFTEAEHTRDLYPYLVIVKNIVGMIFT